MVHSSSSRKKKKSKGAEKPKNFDELLIYIFRYWEKIPLKYIKTVLEKFTQTYRCSSGQLKTLDSFKEKNPKIRKKLMKIIKKKLLEKILGKSFTVDGKTLEIDKKFLNVSGGSHCVSECVYDGTKKILKLAVIDLDDSSIFHEYHVYKKLKEKNTNAELEMHGIISQMLIIRYNFYNFFLLEKLDYSLEDMITTHKTLCEATAYHIFFQLIKCINFLHKNDFLHRDVKPANIMFVTNPTYSLIKKVYLIDFDIAEKYTDSERTPPRKFIGTLNYASTTAHDCKLQQPSDDFLSAVFTILKVYYGFLPWETCQEEEDIGKMKKEVMKTPEVYFNKSNLLNFLLKHEKHRRFDIIYTHLEDLLKQIMSKISLGRSPYISLKSSSSSSPSSSTSSSLVTPSSPAVVLTSATPPFTLPSSPPTSPPSAIASVPSSSRLPPPLSLDVPIPVRYTRLRRGITKHRADHLLDRSKYPKESITPAIPSEISSSSSIHIKKHGSAVDTPSPPVFSLEQQIEDPHITTPKTQTKQQQKKK